MENNKCDCSKCEHWEECEIGLIVHNPIKKIDTLIRFFGLGFMRNYTIKKGDKVAQCTLVEHKGWLMGIESEIERTGGFGSSDK